MLSPLCLIQRSITNSVPLRVIHLRDSRPRVSRPRFPETLSWLAEKACKEREEVTQEWTRPGLDNSARFCHCDILNCTVGRNLLVDRGVGYVIHIGNITGEFTGVRGQFRARSATLNMACTDRELVRQAPAQVLSLKCRKTSASMLKVVCTIYRD